MVFHKANKLSSNIAWAHSRALNVILYFWDKASLWYRVACLILDCFVVMRSTELGCFRSCFWSLWKALDEEECMGFWFHDVWTCDAKVLEYWIIFSLKIKLNRSWKFQRSWNVPLMSLERSWWARFNGIYLVRFGFRMWEIMILKWFLPLKIQINSKKPGFGRKVQLRTW
jgi:hypothetical protein